MLKKLNAIDGGRFVNLFKAVKIRPVCLKCASFNYNISLTSKKFI